MTSLGVRLDPIPQIGIEDSIGLAQFAESLGYDMIWVPEGGGSDSITRLAAFAGSTSKVRLGTGILPVFSRTPALTAMTALGMHIVSGSRFTLGLGVGHRGSAEGIHGIPFRRPMTRIRENGGSGAAAPQGGEGVLPGKVVQREGRQPGLRRRVQRANLHRRPWAADA